MKEFTNLLEFWDSIRPKPRQYIWPLDHKYTNAELALANLKGDDYYRAQHIALGCAEHSEYQLLLANIERRVPDPNDESTGEEDYSISLNLTHIVDREGLKLSLPGCLAIPESFLIFNPYSEGRDPDQQRGGEYAGNQHAEIDRFHSNSVSSCLFTFLSLSLTITRQSSS